MKTLTLSLLAVFGLAVASPAFAFGFGRSADIGEGIVPEQARSSVREIVRSAVRLFLNFRKETPLSDTQKTAISKILDEHRTEIRAQFTQNRAARRAMAESAKADANSAATKAAAEKLGDVTRDRALLMARISAQVRPLLTLEQQQNIEKARAEIESMVDGAFAAALR